MGMTYEDGKEYLRPGVRRKSSNGNNTNAVASARDGIGALPISSDWGPLNTVTTHYVATADMSIKNTYGGGGTISVANAYMDGGLNTLYLVRIGTGGKNGSLELKSGENTAVMLTLKYPGTYKFTASIRSKLGASDIKELVIYDGAKAVETTPFEAGEKEINNLVEAVANSRYVTADIAEGATGTLDAIAQQVFDGGENPTVTTADYMEAFEAFEPYYYNTIALDTVDKDVQAMLKEYLKTAFNDGNLAIAVIGEKGSAELSDRMKNAAQNDDYAIIYFGSDYFRADGSLVNGAEAIATAAGVIASTPSNKSITHMQMPGAVQLTERLKNRQYEEAIQNGLLLLSVDQNGNVIFDSGCNTLINPDVETQDDGWKKIKRAKVRHEAYYRLDCEMDKLIGKVDGLPDGIANVIQRGQAVLDTMAEEKKLIDPIFALDKELGYGADYGYFIITAVDADTLERIFLHYKWKYSENS